jgi:hypothetical protein
LLIFLDIDQAVFNAAADLYEFGADALPTPAFQGAAGNAKSA